MPEISPAKTACAVNYQMPDIAPAETACAVKIKCRNQPYIVWPPEIAPAETACAVNYKMSEIAPAENSMCRQHQMYELAVH